MPSKRKITSTPADADADHAATDASPAASSVAATSSASVTAAAGTGTVSGSGNGPAPAKRQRVSRACDQCRAAREKCDGIQPLCFPCVSQNRPCTYAANPKKRGVQTGYIKTLEVALAWLFEKVPGCEEGLDNLLMHEGGQGQNLLVGKDSDKANRLHKRWRRSKVHREIDRILSGGDSSQSRVEKSSPSDDGDSEAEQGERSSRAVQGSTPNVPGSHSATNGLSLRLVGGNKPAAAPSTTIKLPTNHWRLVDAYFGYTHCWYPILEKQDLLKTVYLYPDTGLDINQLGPASAAHAELWAALALASFQDAASAKPVIHPQPDDVALSPDEIYSIARRLVPTEEGDFDIQHARALLLLALINVGKGKKTSAWILVGHAHRIALDVSELHNNDARSSRRTTAVLMGCYILDTLISVHRRGMPSLETAGIIEGMSIPEDNLDEWQPWAPCEGFGPVSRMSSRSPAYSLTTFNQLYDVFKFMRKRTLQRQNGLLPAEHPSEATLLLHQTIKPRLPFASFIVARDSSSVTIPSAYVLRILFLWVSAIIDSTDESICSLILESVEQYVAQFGACGAPPFFSSCLAMMRQHRSFNDLHPHSRDRWQVIQDILSATWVPANRPPTTTVRPASAVSKAAGAPETPMAPASSHTAPSVASTAPSDLYSSTTLQTPTLLPKQYTPQNNPFAMGTFSPPKPMLNTGVSPGGPAPGLNMLDTQNLMHAAGAQLQHQQTMAPNRGGVGGGGSNVMDQHPHHHRDSFNAGALDYDALLDDLSSMDYIDRVDADPQFMANLGFAPGCDIPEILNREFGAI